MVKSSSIARFTEYRSPCIKNEEMKRNIGSDSPLVYRMYLQKNAGNIMNNNFVNACKKNNIETGCCNVCGKSVNLNGKK